MQNNKKKEKKEQKMIRKDLRQRACAFIIYTILGFSCLRCGSVGIISYKGSLQGVEAA